MLSPIEKFTSNGEDINLEDLFKRYILELKLPRAGIKGFQLYWLSSVIFQYWAPFTVHNIDWHQMIHILIKKRPVNNFWFWFKCCPNVFLGFLWVHLTMRLHRFIELLVQYNDVTMRAMTSQLTSLTIVYSTVYSRRRSKKTSKLRVTGLCVRGIHLWPRNSPHKVSVTRKMFPSSWWRHHEELHVAYWWYTHNKHISTRSHIFITMT